MKQIGQRNTPEGGIVKEYCETANGWGVRKCKVCFAAQPKMRPFYKKLQRLSAAMKARRKELVEQVTQADADQTRYEKDLALADYKLAAAQRRKDELDKE